MDIIAIVFVIFLIGYILNVEILALAFMIGIVFGAIDATPNNINLIVFIEIAIGLINSFLRESRS